MILIVIAATERQPAQVVRLETTAAVVGRDPRCDAVVDAPGVSSQHCRISPMPGVPGAYMLEDLGSTYGTFVNGTRVQRPVVVSHNDAISIGEHSLRVTEPGGEAEALSWLALAPAASGLPPPLGPAGPPAVPSAAPPPAPAVVSPTSAVTRAPGAPTRAPAAPTPEGGHGDWASQYRYFDGLAKAWEASGRGWGGLLRDEDLQRAVGWLRAGRDLRPGPTPLHLEFIRASKRAGRRRLLLVLVGVGFVLAGLGIVLAVLDPDRARAWWASLRDDWTEPTPTDPDAPDEPSTGGEEPDALDFEALVAAASGITDAGDRLLAWAEIARRTSIDEFYSPPLVALQRAAHAGLADRHGLVLSAPGSATTTVAFGPRGRWAIAGSDSNEAILWDLTQPTSARPIRLHDNLAPVVAVGISPDGRWAVTGDEDGELVRWDLASDDPGATGLKLKAHRYAIRGLAFDPKGRWLLTGDDLGHLALWDIEAADATAALVTTRKGHDETINVIVPAPGGGFYTGSDDLRIYRWSVGETGKLRASLRLEHPTGVTAVAAGSSGRWLASGDRVGQVLLWDLDSRQPTKPKAEMSGHDEAISDLGISSDERLLVTASDDDTIRVWEMQASDPSASSVVLAGHTGDITDIEFAADDTRLVSAALDNSLRVWDLTKKDRTIDQYAFEGHAAKVLSIDVSPDGLYALSGADDGTVRIWDILARRGGLGARVLRGGRAQATDADPDATGKHLLVTGGQARVELWDLDRRDRIPTPVRFGGASGLINAGALDGRGTIAAGAEDGTIYLWSSTTPDTPPRKLQQHEGSVTDVAFTPDGSALVSTSSDRSVVVWPMDTLVPRPLKGAHSDEIHALAMAPGGRYVFTGSLDGALVRWDLDATDGSPILLEEIHRRDILALEVSSDGRWLASGSNDRQAVVWDAKTGQRRFRLRDHDEGVSALAFDRGGRRLASGGQDRMIYLWDLEGDHPEDRVAALSGHEQSVTTLAFVEEGDRLASGSNDGSVRLWPLSGGDPLVLVGHDDVVHRVLVPRAGSVVSVSNDGSVRIWPTAGLPLAERICDSLGRPLPDNLATQLLGTQGSERWCSPTP